MGQRSEIPGAVSVHLRMWFTAWVDLTLTSSSPEGNIAVKSTTVGLIVIGLVLLISGCVNEKSARGFRLPDGDPVQGQQNFLALGCHGCHQVEGADLPDPLTVGPVRVKLGGQTTLLRTYGELVTSVINPSHRIAPGLPITEVTDGAGDSVMRNYNDVMTVQQLVDVVAFLQPLYEVVPPEYVYPVYGY